MGRESAHAGRTQVAGYFVGLGFLASAVVLFMLPRQVSIPATQAIEVRADQIKPGPWRQTLGDPPMINIGTLNQRCSDCHILFDTVRDPDRPLYQHTDIHLSHGTNDACLNCHDKDNRERLAIRGQEPVGFDDAQLLCAQCHGPIYRDWQRGTHGKTIGYWNTDLGPAIKLICTQCHDPHHPVYEPIVPLPGPHTLRMGKQGHNGSEINESNPLQRWRLVDDAEPHTSQHGKGHE